MLSRDPIAAYAIPPEQPPAVAEAYDNFDRLGREWAATAGELDDLEAENVRVQADNIVARGEALAAGKKPPVDSSAQEAVIDDKIAKVARQRAALAVALDLAGNELCRVIASAQAEWLERLDATGEEAAERYDAAIKEARAAAFELGRARSAAEWLRAFEPGPATVGRIRGWHGKANLRVNARDAGTPGLRAEYPVADLLAVAALATASPSTAREHVTTSVEVGSV
jgi:hypothetical protein